MVSSVVMHRPHSDVFVFPHIFFPHVAYPPPFFFEWQKYSECLKWSPNCLRGMDQLCNCLQVTSGTNGSAAECTLVEEEPWKRE